MQESPALALKLPGAQAVHDAAPALEPKPAMHGVQAIAPAAENVPAGQLMQAEAPPAEYVPAAHAVQVAPVVPGLQAHAPVEVQVPLPLHVVAAEQNVHVG